MMAYRFLHIADVHLGKHQHQSDARYADYFAVLASVIAHAVGERVQAVLIAGDLFDEQDPSAETIRRAMTALRPLRAEGIPVYAIEGNHDRRKRTEPACALDILAGEGYLHLLRPDVADGVLTLRPYEAESGGGMIEAADGIVIAGLGFLGHNIEEYHRQAAAQLPESGFPIVLSHVMVQPGEQTLEYGCVSYDDIAALRERIGYLALGHRHTRTGMEGEMDSWVFNPGSLEFVNTLDYRLPPELRGFLDVTISDTSFEDCPSSARTFERLGCHLLVRHVATNKRPAHTLRPDINGCERPDAVVAAVRHAATEEIDADLIARQPIVVARLQGTLALSRSRLPRAAIAAMLRDEFGARHVEVMDRDLLGTTEIGTMLVDGDDLEQVADRARAVAADLLRAGGIAVGRESELATTLIDMKTQLHGSAKNPSGEVLQSLRQQILPFVEFEEEEAVGTAADAAEEADAIPDDDDDPEGGAA
jgi:DNA repair exonuclease SbcCD nuclease subunit